MSLAELRSRWAIGEGTPVRQLVVAANAPHRASPFDQVGVKRPRSVWPLTDLKLPLASMPTGLGRSRTFEIRPATERLIQLADALLMTVNTDAKSSTSIYEAFKSYHAIHPEIEIGALPVIPPRCSVARIEGLARYSERFIVLGTHSSRRRWVMRSAY